MARCPKLRVERRPFLAPEAVIFGVVFTGPYILVVNPQEPDVETESLRGLSVTYRHEQGATIPKKASH